MIRRFTRLDQVSYDLTVIIQPILRPVRSGLIHVPYLNGLSSN